MIPGAVMLVSGALCVGGAVASRSRIGIAAASAMALAMLDLVLLGVVSPLIWAVLLLSAGILLGVKLRIDARAGRLRAGATAGLTGPPAAPRGDARLRARLSGDGVAGARARPLGSAARGRGAHAGHGAGAVAVLFAAVALLVAVLAVLAAVTAVRRRGRSPSRPGRWRRCCSRCCCPRWRDPV